MMRRPTKVISRKADTVRIIKITGRLDPGEGPDQLFEMVQRFAEEDEIDFDRRHLLERFRSEACLEHVVPRGIETLAEREADQRDDVGEQPFAGGAAHFVLVE